MELYLWLSATKYFVCEHLSQFFKHHYKREKFTVEILFLIENFKSVSNFILIYCIKYDNLINKFFVQNIKKKISTLLYYYYLEKQKYLPQILIYNFILY